MPSWCEVWGKLVCDGEPKGTLGSDSSVDDALRDDSVSEPVVGSSVSDVAAVEGVIVSARERGIKRPLARGCDVQECVGARMSTSKHEANTLWVLKVERKNSTLSELGSDSIGQ